jgi:hypothetical protein
MKVIVSRWRVVLAAFALSTLGACSNAGGLGSILGSVLGNQQQQGGQASGTVQGIDTRNQQIGLQLSNGQSVTVAYDNNTRVVYQNQNYAVTSLERGDQVTARLQNTQNGGYYTDLVQVDQSVRGGGTVGQNGNVQSLQGTVRRVDQANGWFTVDASNNVTLTITVPQNVSRADLQRFQSLRSGDYVRFYGVFVNNSRVELRQFY